MKIVRDGQSLLCKDVEQLSALGFEGVEGKEPYVEMSLPLWADLILAALPNSAETPSDRLVIGAAESLIEAQRDRIAALEKTTVKP